MSRAGGGVAAGVDVARVTPPMLRFQDSLPRLPIPPLEQTLGQYLENLKPLVTAEELTTAERDAKAFAASPLANRLHQHLLQQQFRTPNWLARLWSDSYLTDRSSPGLHVSPVLGLDPAAICAPLGGNAALIGAHMCATAVRFHHAAEHGLLEPNAVRGKPFCMSDSTRMLGWTRVPQPGRDVLERTCAPRAGPCHAVVMRKGHAFVLPLRGAVLSGDGGSTWTADVAWLQGQLQGILDRTHDVAPSLLGAVTYLDRDDWAGVRAALLRDPVDRFALSQIEESLFVLSLDDAASDSTMSPNAVMSLMVGHRVDAVQQMDRTASSSWKHLNRWWDKSLQLHVSVDGGTAGLTFEHSGQDSLPILSFSAQLASDIKKAMKGVPNQPAGGPHPPPPPPPTVANVTPVTFRSATTDASLTKAAYRGAQALRKTLSKLDLATLELPIDVAAFRQHRLSPDAAVQLALQVGYRAVRGHTPSTYESAATKTFALGRTETLRPVSPAMDAAADRLAMLRGSDGSGGGKSKVVDDASLLKVFRTVCKAHAARARMASAGQGCDRHLFGLLCSAEELGVSLPPLLASSTFARFAKIQLSTTHPFWQAGTRFVGFGPVVSPECLGAGYFVAPREVVLSISSWRGAPHAPNASSEALEIVQAVLKQINDAVVALPPPSASPPPSTSKI